MKTYGQFSPAAKAAEIFARRWTPLIIRELLMGSQKFSEPGMRGIQYSPLLINRTPYDPRRRWGSHAEIGGDEETSGISPDEGWLRPT